MSDIRPLKHADGGVLPREALPPSRRVLRALGRTELALLSLVLVRLLLIALFLLNILPLERRDPVFRWYLQHGGDQILMFHVARSLIDGPVAESVVGIGQPLMMLPWVGLLDPNIYLEITGPLVILNGFVFGLLSILLVYRLGYTATASRPVGLAAAAVWALLPLFAYVGFFWHPESVLVRSATVPKLAWLNGLSDGPATFFLLAASVGLAGIALRRQRGFWPAAGVGAALGAAILFRFHIAPMVAFLLLGLLFFDGWRALLAALGALLIVYLPQAWYNLAVFNLPFTTGYLSYGDMQNWGGTLQRPLGDLLMYLPASPSPANVLHTVAYFLDKRAWLVIPLGLMLAAGGLAVTSLKRRHGWRAVYILLGAPLAYVLPMLTTSNFRDDVIRFSMPALPALIVAAVFAAGVLLEWLNRHALRSGERTRAE